MENIKRFLIRSKYGLFLFGMAFVVAIGLLGGTSYALWKLNFTQTTPNVVSTACFDMTFTELTPSVNLQNAYPISDEKGLETTPYTFKVKNTCTQYGTYAVRLDILNTSTMSADKIKIQLEGDSSISPTILGSLENNAIVESGISSSKVIVSDSLSEQEEKEYSLRIWIDSSAGNEIMNQEFKANIVIEMIASHEPQFLSYSYAFLSTVANSCYARNGNRDYITSLSFIKTTQAPAGATCSVDVGEIKNGKVMAWQLPDGGLVIGAEGGVYAPENSRALFASLTSLTSFDTTNLDISHVTNMEMMFDNMGSRSLNFTLDLGDKFDTSKVTNMSQMFYQTGSVSTNFTLNLGDKFDTSNVTDMWLMFESTGRNSTVFTLDLGDKFDTSKVTMMSSMFKYVGMSSPVFTLDLGDKFDTSNITNMNSMFMSVGSTNPNFTLDLGDKFDTSKVTIMNDMFRYTGSSNSNFYLDFRGLTFSLGNDRNQYTTFDTGSTTHKIYVTNDNSWVIANRGFKGIVVNCTTNPTSCP